MLKTLLIHFAKVKKQKMIEDKKVDKKQNKIHYSLFMFFIETHCLIDKIFNEHKFQN